MQDKADLSTSFWSSQLSTEGYVTEAWLKCHGGVKITSLKYIFFVSGMIHPSKAGKFKSDVYIKVVFVPKGNLLSTYTHGFDYFPKWDTLMRNKKCNNRLWNKVRKLLMILQGQNIPLKKKKIIISHRQNLAFVAFLCKELLECFRNYELSCILKVIFFIASQFSEQELCVASFI